MATRRQHIARKFGYQKAKEAWHTREIRNPDFDSSLELLAMGHDHSGQFGQGEEKKRVNVPLLLGQDVVEVGCGFSHTILLTPTGTVLTTSRDSDFKLGRDLTEDDDDIPWMDGHRLLEQA
jgi:alpha-tubulin suppressor-like RCC1 family protein